MDRDLSGRRDRLIAEIRSFSLDKTGEQRIQLNGLMNRLDGLTILSTPSPVATMTTTTTTSSAIVQTPPQPTQETIPINFQLQMDYIGQKVEYFKTDISQNTARNIVGRSIDIRRELNNLLENMHHQGADLAMITSVETKQSEFIQARDAYLLTTPAETTTAIFLDIFAKLRNKLRNIDEMKFESLDNLRQGFINLIPKLPPEEAEIAKATAQELDNLMTERRPNNLHALPDELQALILSFLDGKDLARQQRVSKTAQRLAKTQSLWQVCCQKELNIDVPEDGDPESVYREEDISQYQKGGRHFVQITCNEQSCMLTLSNYEKIKVKHVIKF